MAKIYLFEDVCHETNSKFSSVLELCSFLNTNIHNNFYLQNYSEEWSYEANALESMINDYEFDWFIYRIKKSSYYSQLTIFKLYGHIPFEKVKKIMMLKTFI